jgi:tRNA(fMet)-specific endonuclease VapC
MFFLDTNAVIGIMTRRAPQFVARIEAELAIATPLLLSTIVLYELKYGACKSAFPQRNLARLGDFLTCVSALAPFDSDDAREAGEIRAHLERQGSPIGPYDILIAAQARRRRMALVTSNRREFERVPALVLTDWSSGHP